MIELGILLIKIIISSSDISIESKQLILSIFRTKLHITSFLIDENSYKVIIHKQQTNNLLYYFTFNHSPLWIAE